MLVRDLPTLERVRAKLREVVRAGTPFGYDTEFDAPTIVHRGKGRPDVLRASLVGYSLCFGREGVYIPVLGVPEDFRTLALRMLRFATVPTARVVCHNAKGEIHVLRNLGIVPRCRWLDTQIAAWLCGWCLPGEGGLKLKALAAVYLGYEGPDFAAVAKGRAASSIPIAELAPYAAKDAELALALWPIALRRMEELDLLRQYDLDRRTIPTVAAMERSGVCLNAEELLAAAARCEAEMATVADRFWRTTETTLLLPSKVREPVPCPNHRAEGVCPEPGCLGGVVHFKNGKPKLRTVERPVPTLRGADVGNDGQVSRWLYDELRWWPTAGVARTERGWSTAEEDIRPFTALPGNAGGAARDRLRFQALRKYAGTYTSTLVNLARQSGDGRLHCSFMQTGTATQRFSSRGPNLQNLPKSERLPLPWLNDLPDVRAAFRAPEGRVFVVRDASQIELRITAHYSQDPALLHIYRTGGDLHAMTMEKLGVTRPFAKQGNFSCIYRITPPALARKISLATNVWPADVPAAARFIEGFYAAYPGVRDMHERFIADAERFGYAETITGFKRPLTDWGRGKRWGTENQAINTPIQGSAGGLIKAVMVELDELWDCEGVDAVFWAQVHDELGVHCPPELAARVDSDMSSAFLRVGEMYGLRVPLESSGGSGYDWAEAKG